MKIYLLSKPWLNWPEFARFTRDEGLPDAYQYMVEPPSDGELAAEIAGRLCYMSFDRRKTKNSEFIANLINHQHFSVLEHANWTFIFTGISRTCTHELVRHRHFSYSQLSQRYVDHTEMKLVKPVSWPAELDAAWDALNDAVKANYTAAADALGEGRGTTERKVARTICRAVLPGAMETKIVVTGNARAWREFIQKRNTRFADPEIRALAAEVLKQLRREAPSMFADLVESE